MKQSHSGKIIAGDAGEKSSVQIFDKQQSI